ncbi:O-methyltransferase [Mycoplasmatota bacterium zrk1]
MNLKQYANDNKVPIIEDDGLEFIVDYIKKNNVKRILEIGTAIGYSAINFAKISEEIFVKTIERDESMFSYASEAIKHYKLENQIEIVFKDALEIDIMEKYDLIFIDAAKAQYIKFFEKFSKNLDTNGAIICDNLDFHGIIHKDSSEIKSRDLRQLMRKLRNFIEFLRSNDDFETVFHKIGDGISVSKRR